jgi:GNAT superfamily N-acetyltransferase
MGLRKPLSVSIKPMDYADIPVCSRYTADAFAADPHTLVKQRGWAPFDLYAITTQGFLAGLEKKTQLHVKAVDDETGETVGHASWILRGIKEGEAAWIGPSDMKPAAEARSETEARPAAAAQEEEHHDSAIDRLHALEDASMRDWLQNGIPADTPCMIVLGLAVAPTHQSRGVGSALLRHGNALADALGVSIWVHSSHQACAAYQKAGFAITNELAVDLDEYAPRPPKPGEAVMGDRGRDMWGRYVIKYMQRRPCTAAQA